MKMIYTVLVYENYTAQLESLLNRFRVNLNDWDRSKVFDLNGARLVNYTIACTEDIYVSITNLMYAN